MTAALIVLLFLVGISRPAFAKLQGPAAMKHATWANVAWAIVMLALIGAVLVLERGWP